MGKTQAQDTQRPHGEHLQNLVGLSFINWVQNGDLTNTRGRRDSKKQFEIFLPL